MTTSPYLRRPLRSYDEVAAERLPRREAKDKPAVTSSRSGREAPAPAEAGDD